MAKAKELPMSAEHRPLSPHLQIYKWQWTMLLSITHRVTGVALAVGTLLLVWWLLALAAGSDAFELVQSVVTSIVGRLVLLGWTWSLFYHLFNGIRHLAWDLGWGYDLAVAKGSGWVVLAVSLIATITTWCFGYIVMSGHIS